MGIQTHSNSDSGISPAATTQFGVNIAALRWACHTLFPVAVSLVWGSARSSGEYRATVRTVTNRQALVETGSK